MATPKSAKILYRVINCTRHTSRLQTFQQNAKHVGINVKRLPCVDGSKFTNAVLCRMMSQNKLKIGKIDGESLTPVEVAISLSHLECWKQLARSKSDYMVIFEDDAHIASDFDSKLRQIIHNLQDHKISWDVIWLYNGNWMKTKSKRKHIVNVPIQNTTGGRPSYISISQETSAHNAAATCYIITRQYAKTLIAKVFPIRHPIDVFMGELKATYLTLDDKSKNMKCPATPLVSLRGHCNNESTQNYDAIQIHQLQCPKKSAKYT